jgi:hypothetical protein
LHFLDLTIYRVPSAYGSAEHSKESKAIVSISSCIKDPAFGTQSCFHKELNMSTINHISGHIVMDWNMCAICCYFLQLWKLWAKKLFFTILIFQWRLFLLHSKWPMFLVNQSCILSVIVYSGCWLMIYITNNFPYELLQGIVGH